VPFAKKLKPPQRRQLALRINIGCHTLLSCFSSLRSLDGDTLGSVIKWHAEKINRFTRKLVFAHIKSWNFGLENILDCNQNNLILAGLKMAWSL